MTRYNKKTVKARAKTLAPRSCANCGMLMQSDPAALCATCAKHVALRQAARSRVEMESCVDTQDAIADGVVCMAMLSTTEAQQALAQAVSEVSASWRYDDWREFLALVAHDMPQEMRDLLPR